MWNQACARVRSLDSTKNVSARPLGSDTISGGDRPRDRLEPMLRLGEYLCEQRLLSEEQLEEALGHQAVYGARLGTNLVELEMIGIERLAECLSDFHKVPLPPRPWLVRPSKEAIQRVTRPLVERLRFIPLRLDGNLLHAAVLSPRDPTVLDDLRFATGCRIEPYVLPEIWMHDWLLTLFSVPRGIRHVETAVTSADDDLFDVDSEQTPRDPEPEREPQPAARRRPPRPAQTSRTTPGLPVAPFLARMAEARARRAAEEAAEHPAEARSDSDSDAADAEPSAAGSSVRPPPITVQSLAELAKSGRTLGGYPAVRPKRTSLWDQQLPESGPADSLQGALAQAREAAERSAVAAPSSVPPPPRSTHPTMPPPPMSMPARELPPPAEMPPPPPKPVPTIAELEAGIRVAADRDELVELSLQAVNRFARHASLFIAQKGVLQGARSVEDGLTRPLDGLLVPLDSPCVLTEIGAEAKPARVTPGAHVLDAQLLRMLGDEQAQEVGLFPVRIRKRMVNLLYASNGAEPLGPVAFAALSALAQLLGKSYERLIIARKTS